AFGRGRNDDLFRTGSNVTFGFLYLSEQAGGFNDNVHAELFPGQLRRVFGTNNVYLRAIDDQDIVFGFIGRAFGRADLAIETPLRGIVFQQVSEIIRRHDIADRDDFDVFAQQSLFGDSPENQAPNTSEPINCNFHSHSSVSQFRFQFQFQFSVRSD